MSKFKKYRRKGHAEIRPYKEGEDLTGISVAETERPDIDKGYIARNPKDHKDQWYINREYFEENFEEIYEEVPEKNETPNML